MGQFLQNLMTASLHGSVVILAVMLLRLLLRKTPKKYICLLWLLAGIRLLMPIEIRSDFSLQPRFSLSLDGLSGTLLKLLPWIWGLVALGFALYSVISYRKLKEQVRGATKIPGGWESSKISTAFILGFIKPKIYIPTGMTTQDRQHILAHERTHLDKGDHWIKMIGFLALALHWFNPLVWAAYLLLCRDIELACDERVVQFMDLKERKSYSTALISCSSPKVHLGACPVAFGEVSVKERILSVLNYKKPSFWLSLLGVLAFFFVAFFLVTTPTRVPASEDTAQQEQQLRQRLEGAWDAVLSQEQYHLNFANVSNDGAVQWYMDIYQKGQDTLWQSVRNALSKEDGWMMLDGKSYRPISDQGGILWVETQEENRILDQVLSAFSLDEGRISGIESQFSTNNAGEEYEKISFVLQKKGENQETVAYPMIAWFRADGVLDGMEVQLPQRIEAQRFQFANLERRGDVDKAFQKAREQIRSPQQVDPEKLLPPSEDQKKMDQWGIFLRMDDDLLTQNGGELHFSQSNVPELPIHTNGEYWLERKTESGWQRLEPKTVPVWENTSYALGSKINTILNLDWSQTYGPLPGGAYRIGLIFENMDEYDSCTGYSEFTIIHSEDLTAEQTAAMERCYEALEQLAQRDHLHWKSISGTVISDEVCYSGENSMRVSTFPGPDQEPRETWSEHDKRLFPRTETYLTYEGNGYGSVCIDPAYPSSEVLGVGLRYLDAKVDVGIQEDFNYWMFGRRDHAASFPEGIGVVSDELVRFVYAMNAVGTGQVYETVTYRFDESGNLVHMESSTQMENRTTTDAIEILDTTAQQIQEKIAALAEEPYVRPFSWQEAQAKYTADKYNIRERDFVNQGGSPIATPIEAARLALKEYANLHYQELEVCQDLESEMWRVTFKSSIPDKPGVAYRDVYMTGDGQTKLLVYEPVEDYLQSRS